jgi:hypothetical protein
MPPVSIPFMYGNGEAGAEGVPTPHAGPGLTRHLFAQLVALHQSNAVLSAELSAVHLNLSRVCDYRESQGANLPLADAHLLRLKARHSAVLTLLRANRVKARSLLVRLEDQDPARGELPETG